TWIGVRVESPRPHPGRASLPPRPQPSLHGDDRLQYRLLFHSRTTRLRTFPRGHSGSSKPRTVPWRRVRRSSADATSGPLGPCRCPFGPGAKPWRRHVVPLVGVAERLPGFLENPPAIRRYRIRARAAADEAWRGAAEP